MLAVITFLASLGGLLSFLSFLFLGLFFHTGWAGGGPLLWAAILIGLLTLTVTNVWLIKHRKDACEKAVALKGVTALSAVGTLCIIAFWLFPLLR